MLNYMRAEFYKVLHRRGYLIGFLAFLLLGEGVILFAIIQVNNGYEDIHNTYASVVNILVMMLQLGLYCAIIIGDMVFSDQYKYNTLKNEISFGISRVKAYFGKLMFAAVLSILLMAAVLGVYLGVGRLFVPFVAEDAQYVYFMGVELLKALPLWLGSLSVAMAFYFNIHSNTAASFVTVGVVAVLPGALKLFYLVTERDIWLRLRQLCLAAPFDGANGSWESCGMAWLIGLGWIAVSSAIGAGLFSRREIN